MGIHDAFGGTTKLTFDTEEFHNPDFSVDSFIQRKRQSVPLDVLRDDLGSHLKTLRSSLIELINQDYGQFVNLSSNLVGLDGRIQSIVGPLTRVKNDIQGFDELLESNFSSLNSELSRKRNVREAKAQLQYLRMASTALEISGRLVAKLPSEIVSSVDFNLLESACDEVAETKFLLQCCRESCLQKNLQKDWSTICNNVLEKLNGLLKVYANISYASSEDEKKGEDTLTLVKSLLYMYTELQCEKVVEEVLTKEVLAPKCDVVLSKKGNIGALFDEIEAFCSYSPLFAVWKKLDYYPWMERYDFVTRGVFPFVLSILSKHFPHIWSPSNPETFHSNWMRCEAFIYAIEDNVPSLDHLHKFRNSDHLHDFIAKWQFPVYFQLRFYSIASELESALEDVTLPCVNIDYKLDASRVMVKTLNQCWDKEKVFISKIAGRFLKASALIISRYIKEIQSKIASNKTASTQMFINAYCDLNLSELVVGQIITEKMNQELQLSVHKAVSETAGDPIDSLNPSAVQFLSEFQWSEVKRAIETNLIEMTISQCSTSISSVNEVPRLYRRTNRDAPTKHLEYVESILSPLSTLKNDLQNAHQLELWDNIGDKIGNQIVHRYEIQVQEVLVSVQKMEESLRRLKKVKGQNQPPLTGNKGLTDDDKIRQQIQLDVNYCVKKFAEICPLVNTSGLRSLFENTNGVRKS